MTAARGRAAHAGCGLRVRGAALKSPSSQRIEKQSPRAHARAASVTVWLGGVPAKEGTPEPPLTTPVAASPKPSSEATGAWPTCAEVGLPLKGSDPPDPDLEGPVLFARLTPGPTELVSGLFVGAYPPPRRTLEPCEERDVGLGPGTVEVRNSSGELVASQPSGETHFAEITLPPGTYQVTATFLGVKDNGEHPQEAESVTIPAGYSVRKDFLVELL